MEALARSGVLYGESASSKCQYLFYCETQENSAYSRISGKEFRRGVLANGVLGAPVGVLGTVNTEGDGLSFGTENLEKSGLGVLRGLGENIT